MNVAQQILDLIFKTLYHQQFKSSFTEEERSFAQRIRMLDLSDFRLERLSDRSAVITWKSGMHHDVAVYVGEDGFQFTKVEIYKASLKRMKGLAKGKISADEMKVLDSEIEEIKKSFRVYCQDAQAYFK